jgi:hypothetical protein
MSRFSVLVATLSLAISSPGLTTGPTMTAFTNAAVNFTMPIPAGYCPTTGEIARWVAERSAKDMRNETKASLAPCDTDTDPITSLIVVTTARRPAPAGMTREKMLRLFADLIKRPDIRAGLKQGDPREPQLGDIDDFCLYVEMDVASNAAGVPARGTGCLTMVGGQALTVFKVGFGAPDKDLTQLKREVRALAESIMVVSNGS